MEKKFLVLLIFGCFLTSKGQNNAPPTGTDSLFSSISQLQATQDSFYTKGMFGSQRAKHRLREDNNVFFSALIAFTLNNTRALQSERNRQLTDSICKKVVGNYSFYKNQKGINTVNFWKTNPPQYFPNAGYLSRHKYFNLPDDADCTALVYLTDTSLKSEALWLKQKLAQHANGTTACVKSTFSKYRNLPAYSTWFGKKMPIEFDICVESNILYFVMDNHIPFTANDSATVALLKGMIQSGEYLRNAAFVSPSYKKPSIVLYHLARLLGIYNVPGLDDCRSKIKSDIETQLSISTDFMERIILSTAYIRMGGQPKEVSFPINLEKEVQSFVFFEADLFSPYARPSLKFISRSKIFAIPFRCKAYSLALIAEYEVLKNNR